MFSVYGTTLDFVPYTDVGARRAIEAEHNRYVRNPSDGTRLAPHGLLLNCAWPVTGG